MTEHGTSGIDARAARASILLVEDGQGAPPSATGLLLRERGYVVHEASSSGDALALALALAATEPPDVLVTELYTPRLNGVALAARVARAHPFIEVVFLTELGPEQIAYAVGVQVVALRRPFSIAVLCDRIDAALATR